MSTPDQPRSYYVPSMGIVLGEDQALRYQEMFGLWIEPIQLLTEEQAAALDEWVSISVAKPGDKG